MNNPKDNREKHDDDREKHTNLKNTQENIADGFVLSKVTNLTEKHSTKGVFTGNSKNFPGQLFF